MKRLVISILVIVVVCVGIILTISMAPNKELSKINAKTSNKPIILITVDSLMSEPLQKVMKDGDAPAFEFLVKNGHYLSEVISSYPTMSVTIDSTILTGTYANQHNIPGLIWFDKDANRIISYGSGFGEIWSNGLKNVAVDSVVHLNMEHLNKEVTTIHEELAHRNIPSGSVNGLLYRGSFQQRLTVPKILSLTDLLPKKIEMDGPLILSLGALSQYNPKNDRNKFVWKRMGVNNYFTANELIYFLKQEKLPPFTLAYLPDADASIHKNGPGDTKGIIQADKALQLILNSFSSWEEAIEKVTWIVVGDSGQSTVLEDKEKSLIDLNKALENFTFWGKENTNGQLAIAVNERMAYIYLNDNQIKYADIVNVLKQDDRISFLAWREGNLNYVISPNNDSPFTFSPEGTYTDEFKQTWKINGPKEILDLTIQQNSLISYNNYPDALARLHGAMHSHEGRFIIVDANPTFEFIEKHSHDHAGGGAHGSLHKVDSVVPMIIVGTDEQPMDNRLVSLKSWILQLIK